jgi:hypothetical protein
MENIRQLDSSYGDMPPWGKGPEQGPIYDGPEYITKNFPKLDKFDTCTVERRRIIPENKEEDTDREEANNQEEEKEEARLKKMKKYPTPEQVKAILEQDKRELGATAQGKRIITNSYRDGNEQHQKASLSGDETNTADSAKTTSTLGVGAVLALFVVMMMMMILFQRNYKKQKATGKAN